MAGGVTSWWIIWAPDAPAGEPSYTLFQGAKSQADAEALKVVAGSADGPYATKADAQQAVTSGSAKKPPSTAQASNQPSLSNVPVVGPVIGGITSDVQAIGDVAAALEAFFSAITDAKMWKSLGWLLLGVAFLTMGILLWLRIPQRAANIGTTAARAVI